MRKATACAFLMFLAICCNKEVALVIKDWNLYNGELSDYKVSISETLWNDGNWERIVHIEPINGFKEPVPYPFSMSGHDYDGDGKWERIFIRFNPMDGPSAIRFESNGEKIWEPYPYSEPWPFTDEQIGRAWNFLNHAMRKFYNPEHRVLTQKEYQEKG